MTNSPCMGGDVAWVHVVLGHATVLDRPGPVLVSRLDAVAEHLCGAGGESRGGEEGLGTPPTTLLLSGGAAWEVTAHHPTEAAIMEAYLRREWPQCPWHTHRIQVLKEASSTSTLLNARHSLALLRQQKHAQLPRCVKIWTNAFHAYRSLRTFAQADEDARALNPGLVPFHFSLGRVGRDAELGVTKQRHCVREMLAVGLYWLVGWM